MAFVSSRIWLTSFVPTWWSNQTNSVVIAIGLIAAVDSIVSGKLKTVVPQGKGFEPQHDKTNKMMCVHTKDSDQPGPPPSLIRVFAVHSRIAKDLRLLHADSEL